MGRKSPFRAALGFGLGAALAILVVAPTVVRAQCSTIGPTGVTEQQSFQLCGPYGYRYAWYGPRVPAGANSRCLNIDGLERGAYEYVLVISDASGEIGRCTHVVNVGNSTGGVASCAITGPDIVASGGTAELCATGSIGLHSYEWSGPGGFTSTAGCVTVSRAGTYTLTTRNTITGSRRTCTHVLRVSGTTGGDETAGDCGSFGPTTITRGGSVRLCGPSYSNVTYRWTRPNAATIAGRCIDATTAGPYVLTITDRATGAVTRCSQTLSWNDEGPYDDPDATVSDNCPRTMQYWTRLLTSTGNTANALGTAEVQDIAATVDARSSYFNWTNDVTGLRQALNPPRPMTKRKKLARQYAALLANVAAGERNAYDGSSEIGLDVDTPVTYGGATTIRELMGEVESMLSTGRGNFNRAASTLAEINAGRGIGTTCE
jgi:hypothetical protein